MNIKEYAKNNNLKLTEEQIQKNEKVMRKFENDVKLKGDRLPTLGFGIPNLLKFGEDGYMDFIPVKVIEVNEYNKCLKVEVAETGSKVLVPNIYRFEKIHEPQKVAVPKLVAEWIKKYKENGCRLANALDDVFDDVELSLYIKRQERDYTEIIAKAWLSYPNITVEQEKLYTVEIPNPNRPDIVTFLYKENGKVFIGTDIFLDEVPNYKWKNEPENQLTEAEIKKDFDFLWQFAKEVEK